MAKFLAEAGFRMRGIHEPAADPGTPADLLPPGLKPGQQFIGFLFFDLEAL
jgi:hypothetical protein